MGELPAVPITAATSPSPLRVLFVDDQPFLARLSTLMIESGGHTATTATSGEEALERLASAPYDVVVCDLALGAGMNGWDLLAHVKARWPDTPFVLATGSGGRIDRAEARERGVAEILSKPYGAQDLLNALAAAMARPDLSHPCL